MAQLHVISQIIGETPILLLDDVTSELDYNRNIELLKRIDDFQCIITTTDMQDEFKFFGDYHRF